MTEDTVTTSLIPEPEEHPTGSAWIPIGFCIKWTIILGGLGVLVSQSWMFVERTMR